MLRQISNRSKGSKAVGLEFRSWVVVAVADSLGGGRLGNDVVMLHLKMMTVSTHAMLIVIGIQINYT